MKILLEFVCIQFVFLLYWLNRARRKYLWQRIGKRATRNVYQFGRNLGVMLRGGKLRPKGNLNLLKKGGILYSFHFGVWELMPRTLTKMGYNLGIVVNRYCEGENRRNILAWLADKFLFLYRAKNSVRVFYKEDVKKIVQFVNDGGVFGILVDGNTFYGKFKMVEKLSRICRVPVIPFAAYQNNGEGVLEIDCDLDGLIKRRPLDYLWFYKSRANEY